MKKYIIFSLLFISFISLLVYIQDNDTTTLSIFGINIILKDAIWIALFLGLFFISSLLFFLFINFKSIFYRKRVEKEINYIIENIKNRILIKDNFKNTKILNTINEFTENIEGLNIKFNKTDKFEFLEDIKKIENGEVVEIKKYKLNNDNIWYIKNMKNLIDKDEKEAKNILKKTNNPELKEYAFRKIASSLSIKEILNYEFEIDFEIIKTHINDDEIKLLLEKAKLAPIEEIEIAKLIYNSNPEEEFNKIEPLKWGSCYLAFKYSHLEKAKDLIENYDLKFFEYFLYIIESNKKADIDEYIQSRI